MIGGRRVQIEGDVAYYSASEMRLMAGLPGREAHLIHVAKSVFPGSELLDGEGFRSPEPDQAQEALTV